MNSWIYRHMLIAIWSQYLNQFTVIITPGENVIPNHENKNNVVDLNSGNEKRESKRDLKHFCD